MKRHLNSIGSTMIRLGGWLLTGTLLVFTSASWASQAEDIAATGVTRTAGQSVTQLPDSNWLLLGGQNDKTIASNSVVIANFQTGERKTLSVSMSHGRSGHTATLMPDGKILILGGRDARGQFVPQAEQLDPETGDIELLADLALTRSGHTATVLADGTLLIAGGWCAKDKPCSNTIRYTSATHQVTELSAHPATEHINSTATLQPDGSILYTGGHDKNQHPLPGAERYDPTQQRFIPLDGETAAAALQALQNTAAPAVLSSQPTDGATAASLKGPLIIRFNGWMNVSTLSKTTVNLIGPRGVVPARITPVEHGLLLFIAPEQNLLPASHYTLFIDGAMNNTGHKLPFTAITFTTAALNAGETATGSAHTTNSSTTGVAAVTTTAETGTGDTLLTNLPTETATIANAPSSLPKTGATAADTADEDERWIPGPRNYRGEWTSGRAGLADQTPPKRLETLRANRLAVLMRDGRIKPETRETQLPALKSVSAARGITALTGQTLKLNGRPLSGVTIRIGKQSAITDDNGEFLLTRIPTGTVVLEIDGRSATIDGKQYGRYFYQTSMDPGIVNALPQPIWMTRLDTEHAVQIPSPTIEDVEITNPLLPNMKVTLPAGTVIRDADGNVVTEISLTPVPADQPPFPMPYGEIPVYYTLQPGGAVIESITGKPQGAKVTYPNYSTQPPGARFDIFDHDPEGRGWYVYGKVKVSEDRKNIEGDKDFILYRFQASSAASSGGNPPEEGTPDCETECCDNPAGGTDGDPVSCRSGQFLQYDDDAHIKDTVSISLQRSYRNEDPNQRSFGVGAGHNYDLYIYLINQVGYTAKEVHLILGNGGRIPFTPTGTDTDYRNATYQSLVPGKFYKATLKGTYMNGFTISLKDGTTYEFSWYNSRLRAIQDRWGNRLGVVRDGSGRTLQIGSPNGRFLSFQYGNPDCATCVTRIIDNIGRQTSYEYDSNGRLTKATNPAGGITTYTFDAATGRMVSVQEPRFNAGETDKPKVTNVYYTEADGKNLNGKVKKQTYADGSTYQFVYQFDANGKVKQTDVTNGRGYIRRIEYTDDGLIAKETRALGTPETQTTIREWDSTARLLKSYTDALNRKTAYEYDYLGNRIKVTRMAGTNEAVSTTYTYNAAYNTIASITDPLGHTISLAYDAKGSLTKATDANGNSVTTTYNATGQPLKITDALGKAVQMAYSNGDLTTATDALNRTSILTLDAVGRVLAETDALGNTYTAEYDALDQLIKQRSPMNQSTAYSYDADGNLTLVTNAKGNTHPFAYGSRGALISEKDPMGLAETYQYDAQHNLTQSTDRKGQTTRYTYDGLNRLTRITYADNSTVTYTWDKANRLTLIVDSQNGTLVNTWDSLNRLTRQTTPKGTTAYTYYPNGLRKTMTVNGQPALTYTYDNGNRLTRIDQAAGATNNNVAQSIAFTYDNTNRRTQIKLPNGQTKNYTWDDAGQLTSIVYKNADNTVHGDLTYAYDAVGRRIGTSGSLNKTSLPENHSSTVNANNQLTSFNNKALTYDRNGNLTSDGTNTYTWNARNQLTSISGQTNATFTYDPLGRRQTRTIDGEATGYVYDGYNIVQELNGANTSNTTANIRANYLMGGIDEVFAQQSNGQTLTYLTDALGSTARMTDSTGSKVIDYTYDPYGNTTADATIYNPFQYTGRENDGNGLYYYRARYYSPTYQRFISEDPIGLNGGINVYAYVNGNPINYVDPQGKVAIGIPIGIGIGIGICYAGGYCQRFGQAIWGALPVFDWGGQPSPSGPMASEKAPGFLPGDKGAAEWGRRNGCGPDEGRRRFHKGVKQGDNMSRPTDNYSVNPETGDVADPEGEIIGNLDDVNPK